jgi:hypothetical protein
MSWTDLLLAGGIAGGAIYLLYRSIWKKGGHCSGCDSGYVQGRARPALVGVKLPPPEAKT